MVIRRGLGMSFFANPAANAPPHASVGVRRPDANDCSCHAVDRPSDQRTATAARRSTWLATDWIDVGMVF
jgi:hypothetical protein